MTQDFQVSVTPVGNDRYLIRTERVAPGVPLAEEQVLWAVEEWLSQAQQLMHDPLLTILRGSGGVSLGSLRSHHTSGHPLLQSTDSADSAPANSVFDLVSLGQRLYGALFQGTIRDSWMTAQGIAQHRQELLRLRLGLKGDRLWRLPWEVLHGGDRPLATGTDVVFSRYQFGPGVTRPLLRAGELVAQPAQPLRVLMAIAAPTDQDRLDLAREALHLKEELLAVQPMPRQHGAKHGVVATEIQLTVLQQPDREQLTRELEQGHYQVLHYSGHSNPGESGGDLYLVSGRTGLTETLSGDDLAGLLVNNGIRLAVFNSCRSAYIADAPDSSGERNLAEALIRRGVPAVLAMAERIPDEVALTLTRLFYRNLKQGYPIDLSLSRTRQGLLSAYGSNQLYWALPILYLNPEFDGCLVAATALTKPDPTSDHPLPSPSPVVPMGDPQEIWSDGVPGIMVEPVQDMGLTNTGLVKPTSATSPMAELTNLADDWEQDDHPTYTDDASVVSDLIRQLSQANGQESETRDDEDICHENLLPDELLPSPATYEDLALTVGGPTGDATPRASTTSPETILPVPNSSAQTSSPSQVPQINGSQSSPSKLVVSTTPVPPVTSSSSSTNGKRMVLVGVLGGVAIGGVALWGWQTNWQWVPTTLFMAPSAPPSADPPPALPSSMIPIQTFNPDTANLKAIKTTDLTAIAVAKFNQGDLAAGGRAMEELLDRVALKEAETSLAAVPSSQTGDAYVSYLRGRLAWQFLQQSETHAYSRDDVRRAWETAVRLQPSSTLYRNALGFVHYADDRLTAAEEQWTRVLALLNAQAKPTTAAQRSPSAQGAQPVLTRNANALTAYAGIALALAKAAEDKPPAERQQLLVKATDYYQAVMTQDPINFQSQALGQNWLWTEEAIRAWSDLGKQR